MKLEEAKANIRKEVVLDEKDGNFKLTNKSAIKEYGASYKMIIAGINHHHVMVNILAADGSIMEPLFARPEAIKLKEQPMQNYKIKVTPETSAEAQELFFELGYKWVAQEDGYQEPKYTDSRQYIFAYQKNMKLTAPYISLSQFESHLNQEITLTQLLDLVVLKRNDVGDATHTDNITHNYKYYVGANVYTWEESGWHKSDLTIETIENGGISLRSDAQMTWQDALRAVADGKEVEFYSEITSEWVSVSSITIGSLEKSHSKFRLAPQRKELNGKFTKEELLKIAGEME